MSTEALRRSQAVFAGWIAPAIQIFPRISEIAMISLRGCLSRQRSESRALVLPAGRPLLFCLQ